MAFGLMPQPSDIGKGKDDKAKILIHDCAECGGPIYEGEPRVRPYCMGGWMCKQCITDMDPDMLEDESTIKVHYKGSAAEGGGAMIGS